MRLRQFLSGLILLFLSLSLLGCASKPTVVVEYIEPDAQYLQETKQPVFTGSKNKDLITYIREVQSSLQECNDDKQAVRSYVEKLHADRP